ncbi:sulfatase [Halorussus gelatinilyticus]|uniref:Sulfatase n=1 Tax=Halorussus gelatinilyticus TaxID=2937524 RepID=A0A8U0IGX3_9EURY|nr:sulfatase [Halorussus gelatinilyticus]UPW00317.1 sulfatase [Halorussus gelatinilyticus]
MTDRSNVILLVFDTLRADALSCYDRAFPVETTAFDRVARRGTVFENAFAVGPWTPPSHGAMFSGRYPSDTGFDGAWPTMPESVPLLAEWFSDRGYRTYGIPGPAKMGSATGLDRGFDEYYEVYEEVAKRPSLDYLRQLVTDPLIRRDFLRLAGAGNDYYSEIKFDRLREWLADAPEPFFAMANLTTVHSPYDPPRPYKRAATPELSRPRFGLAEELLDAPCEFDDPEIRDERLFDAADGADATSIALRYFEDDEYVSDAELDVLREWYAASLRYLDDRLGAFLDWLDRQGLADDTLLVLTSDHGELFGEHGGFYHGDFLYDEVTRVPLVVSGPGVPAGERRTDLASHIDLFATLCDLCGLDAPETDGSSLLGDARRDAVFAAKAPSDERDAEAASEVSEETLREFEVGRKSIRTDEYRFELRSDGEEVLYELPGEAVVSDPDEAVVAPLRERLAATLGESFDGAESATDAEYSAGVERNLRELGYLE